MSSIVGGEAIWEAFYETIWARVIESQKLPRDSGESIFAARHQDVSQGPLGRLWLSEFPCWKVKGAQTMKCKL